MSVSSSTRQSTVVCRRYNVRKEETYFNNSTLKHQITERSLVFQLFHDPSYIHFNDRTPQLVSYRYISRFSFVSFHLFLSASSLFFPSAFLLSIFHSPILDRMTSILNMNCAWIALSLTQQHTQGQNFVTSSSITFSGAKLALV